MSGGYFDYKQYQLGEVADRIDEAIRDNGKVDEWGGGHSLSDKTIDKFKSAIDLLRFAEIYVQRIDWLLSCDDGEESFHKRLDEDLMKLTREAVSV